MKWLVVVLVLLQTCWGKHPKTPRKLVLPNVGEWDKHLETKGFIQGDITPRKDESASTEEEEYSDEMEVSPSIEEEEYSDEMLTLPDNEETKGFIQGDITPSKDVSPSKEDEEHPDEMEVSPSKEEEEHPEVADNAEKLLDADEIEPTGETIVITKRSSKRGSQWPNGVIPYVIDRSVSGKSRQLINSAIADFKKYTCIKFVPRRGQTKYAVFTNKGKDSGCNSPIGVPKGRSVNTINLEEPGCQKHGTVLHEMCHTIGLHHEQTRVDRNQFVRFIRNNVQGGKFDANFQSNPNDPKFWQSFNTPYDYYSIMHYGAFAFSRNGQRTIITTDKNVQYLIGTMDHMSPTDAKQINLMYKCPQWWKYQKPPAFQCVDEKKRCDMYITQNGCPKVYGICCKSCRDGVKCKDYKDACGRVAKQGGCKYGNVNYKYAKQNCCKSCKGGGGSVTPKKRTGGRRTVTPTRRNSGRRTVTPTRRNSGRRTVTPTRRTGGRRTGYRVTTRVTRRPLCGGDKNRSCNTYKNNGWCKFKNVRDICCRSCTGSGK